MVELDCAICAQQHPDAPVPAHTIVAGTALCVHHSRFFIDKAMADPEEGETAVPRVDPSSPPYDTELLTAYKPTREWRPKWSK